MSDQNRDYEQNQTFEEISDLLRDLKRRTQEAQDRGDVEMTKLYNQLVKLVSPVVEAYFKRLNRKTNAELNRKTREMSRAEWEKQQEEIAERQRAKLAEMQAKWGGKSKRA